MGIITSKNLEDIRERKIPLLIQSLLLFFIIKVIINIYEYPELYFFFLGILISSLSALFMIIFKIKASLHMLSSSAVTIFTIIISMHFGINLTLLIATMMVANGLIGTSRLHQKAHTNQELIIGLLIGVIPQILLVNLWL